MTMPLSSAAHNKPYHGALPHAMAFAQAKASLAGRFTPSQDTRAIAVDLRDVGVRYGTRRVLERLTLSIPAGQFVAVIGKSGCGKSTLLRLLAGLEPAAYGALSFEGHKGEAPVRMMFQEPRLLPWARVVDNVALGAGLGKGFGAQAGKFAKARSYALELLGAVGLLERAHDWPSALSGGQRQRVAFARALMSRPKLLACDEPFGALDALTRLEMQDLLEETWQKNGFTAVLVTHDVTEALKLADRVLLLEAGAVAEDFAVPLPRPRVRGNALLAELEGLVLARLLDGARFHTERFAHALGALLRRNV